MKFEVCNISWCFPLLFYTWSLYQFWLPFADDTELFDGCSCSF